MTGSRIERVLLMNRITWPVRELWAREGVAKALKKDKNNILDAQLGYIGKSHSKQISHMVDDIDGNPTNIYFCEIGIKAKITKNSSKKPISAMTEKLKRVHIDLWQPALDIFLQENQYIWTTTDQVTGQV